jgi:hypothetical protein
MALLCQETCAMASFVTTRMAEWLKIYSEAPQVVAEQQLWESPLIARGPQLL